jgi:predicted lactoylglutathione lyase
MIFINLPVKDLAASIGFYEAVGAVRNNEFADDSTQMVSFTPRKIPDAHETAQVLLALSEVSRADVDATAEKALAAGGTEPNPRQDYGFMYGRSFADLDGHIWEVSWMDMDAAMAAHEEAAA